MRTRSEVEALVRRLYQQTGSQPDDLIQIKPVDGEWGNALSYSITRKDGKHTTIYRRDVDDSNENALMSALRRFE